MKKLKRFIIVIAMLIGFFAIYVQIVNRNSVNMTFRQKMLKAAYPAFMWFTKLTKSNNKSISGSQVPLDSFYTLKTLLNNGDTLNFDSLKGKKILLVNTASDCGYTNQYEQLQQLYEENKDNLVIIGFPANDFKAQEKGSDSTIAQFCKINYGVTFPLSAKSVVINNDKQNDVFKWLTTKALNGWNDNPPVWNFSKFLVNEKGELTHYFQPSVSPLSQEVINSIKN